MKRFLTIFSTAVILLVTTAVPLVALSASIPFDNPLQAVNLPVLLDTLGNKLMPFAMTIVSVYIIIAGFRYIIAIAGGQADSAKKAKELFMPALEFALIIAGGSVILHAVINFVKKF